jgi:hypothetical protein
MMEDLKMECNIITCELNGTDFCKDCKSKAKTVYTMKSWENDNSFNAIVGQQVADDVVEEYSNCVPPEYFGREMIITGEAYTHAYNKESEKMEAVYDTFKKHNGQWYYAGLCNSKGKFLTDKRCFFR